MKRREFIGKIAASFVVVQGLYMLQGCANPGPATINAADLSMVKEGIVLCGDATGILDPAAGQGILNA